MEIILAAFSLHRHCKSSSVIFQSSKHSPGAEGSNSSNSVDTKNKTPFFLTSNGKVQPPWICLLCQKAETGTDEKHQISIDFWSRIVAFCINQCLT